MTSAFAAPTTEGHRWPADSPPPKLAAMRTVLLFACSLLACASTATSPAVSTVASEAPPSEAPPSSPTDVEPQEPDVFSPATAGPPNCEVTVSALLSATMFRGSGAITPALQERLDADLEFARMYGEEDHFDQYIECVYEVRLTVEPTQRYQWRHEVSNTLEDHTVAVCNGLGSSIATDIILSLIHI